MVLTLGLPVPTSTESDAAAGERGDASRIACARPRVRGQPQKRADRVGLPRQPSLSRNGQKGRLAKAALALSLLYWTGGATVTTA